MKPLIQLCSTKWVCKVLSRQTCLLAVLASLGQKGPSEASLVHAAYRNMEASEWLDIFQCLALERKLETA